MALSRADIHIHTTYSDGLLEPEDAVNYAVTQTDLRVLAITDHNTIDGARHAHEYWRTHREEFGQIEVIIGEEISSIDGHILGLFLHETIPPHQSAADTVRAIHDQGGIAIAAHPFTHLLLLSSDMKGVGRQLADLPLDGVEVRNSAPTEIYANWITARYNAQTRRHTAVGGSDCHYLPMLGSTHTWFEGQSAQDLQRAIRSGEARPGGRVVGPLMTLQFVVDQLRRRQLPLILPNDHQHRHAANGLTVDVEELRTGPGAVLHCAGQIVRSNAQLLKTQGTHLLDAGITSLVVDLEQVGFVDSAGLGALVALQKRASARNGQVVLCALQENVALSVKLVRLDRALVIRSDESQALHALNLSSAQSSSAGTRRAP
jgi:anti-anti-sigma factor